MVNKLDYAKEKLDKVVPEMLKNPAFLYEFEKIINSIYGDFYIEVSKNGNRVVITENYEINNRYDEPSFD